MAIRTVSAARVLPEELLRQLSDALGGGACCLWVPARKNLNRLGRNPYIVRLHEEGHSAADIADRLFISERTVWRVLAKERARRAPSARASSKK
jgi:DNA-binding NarL/FixJ family response regulator